MVRTITEIAAIELAILIFESDFLLIIQDTIVVIVNTLAVTMTNSKIHSSEKYSPRGIKEHQIIIVVNARYCIVKIDSIFSNIYNSR